MMAHNLFKVKGRHFELPGPTPAVGSHCVRSRKTIPIRITWCYTRSRESSCPIQENLTHSNHLVLHTHKESCCPIQEKRTHSNHLVLHPQQGVSVQSRKTLPIRITWSYTRSKDLCCAVQENLIHSNLLVLHPQQESLLSDTGKHCTFESLGPTPAVGSHVVRSRKTLPIRIPWFYTRSRESCCPIQENLTHSNHMVLHPQQEVMLSDPGKPYSLASPGPIHPQ